MEKKSVLRRLTFWVAALVVLFVLYVASVGPFALAQQHLPALESMAFVYEPLVPLDEATDHKLRAYASWWMQLIPTKPVIRRGSISSLSRKLPLG